MGMAHGQDRREQLITNNLRLVGYVVGRICVHLPNCIDQNDLMGAGTIGLIRAVDEYDKKGGVKFSTYASRLIYWEVMDVLRGEDWIPRSLRRGIREVEQLESRLGRPPNEEEIAETLGISVPMVQKIEQARHMSTFLSLEEQQSTETEENRLDNHVVVHDRLDGTEDPYETVSKDDLVQTVMNMLCELPPDLRQVLLEAADGRNLQDLGRSGELGRPISSSRVSQMKTAGVMMLRTLTPQDLQEAMGG